ncbi:hypothetical protein J7F02_01570 [Streptomyces sp. ISL-112]|nr:hypothetical protein [Streptomyces sp. ISL-112]MBT2464962.1 hypothetical protein [Streptomyces sp. ISL-63]
MGARPELPQSFFVAALELGFGVRGRGHGEGLLVEEGGLPGDLGEVGPASVRQGAGIAY